MTVTHIIIELWEKKTFHSVNSSVVQLELIDIPFKNKVSSLSLVQKVVLLDRVYIYVF